MNSPNEPAGVPNPHSDGVPLSTPPVWEHVAPTPTPHPQSGPARNRWLQPVACLLVGALVAGVLSGWIGYRSGMAAEKERVAPALQELDELRAEKARSEYESSLVPDLRALAERTLTESFATFSGSKNALKVNAKWMDDALEEFIEELGFSPAVIDRMLMTRALDGTQSAEGHLCRASWTYHPDDGLQIVFETVMPG